MVNFGHFIEIKILCISRTEFQEKKKRKLCPNMVNLTHFIQVKILYK
jgi:hypothetical protein